MAPTSVARTTAGQHISRKAHNRKPDAETDSVRHLKGEIYKDNNDLGHGLDTALSINHEAGKTETNPVIGHGDNRPHQNRKYLDGHQGPPAGSTPKIQESF